MENCFVSKLKGVVNNDNLTPFGGLNIKFENSSNAPIGFKCVSGSQTFIVKTSDGSNKICTSDEYTNPVSELEVNNSASEQWLFCLSGDYHLIVDNKENVKSIKSENANLVVDLDELQYTSINQLVLKKSTLKGKLKSISGISYYGNVFSIESSYLYDNDFKNLAYFSLASFGYGLRNSNIEGKVEDYVLLKRALGSNSGTFTTGNGGAAGIQVSLNGTTVSGWTLSFSWEPNSSDNKNTDITCGETVITIDPNGNVIS